MRLFHGNSSQLMLRSCTRVIAVLVGCTAVSSTASAQCCLFGRSAAKPPVTAYSVPVAGYTPAAGSYYAARPTVSAPVVALQAPSPLYSTYYGSAVGVPATTTTIPTTVQPLAAPVVQQTSLMPATGPAPVGSSCPPPATVTAYQPVVTQPVVTAYQPPKQEGCFKRFCRMLTGGSQQTAYRPSTYSAPITYYRPQTVYSPITGATTTVQQPCTSTVTQIQQNPYSVSAPVMGMPAPAAPACNNCNINTVSGTTTGAWGSSVAPIPATIPSTYGAPGNNVAPLTGSDPNDNQPLQAPALQLQRPAAEAGTTGQGTANENAAGQGAETQGASQQGNAPALPNTTDSASEPKPLQWNGRVTSGFGNVPQSSHYTTTQPIGSQPSAPPAAAGRTYGGATQQIRQSSGWTATNDQAAARANQQANFETAVRPPAGAANNGASRNVVRQPVNKQQWQNYSRLRPIGIPPQQPAVKTNQETLQAPPLPATTEANQPVGSGLFNSGARST